MAKPPKSRPQVCSDPAQTRIISLTSKKIKKNPASTILGTIDNLLPLKSDVNVPTVQNNQTTNFIMLAS